MNRIHRVVFNSALGLWQAVSEIARAQGKASSSRPGVGGGAAWLAIAAMAAPLSCAWAQASIVVDDVEQDVWVTNSSSTVQVLNPVTLPWGFADRSLLVGNTGFGRLRMGGGATVGSIGGVIGYAEGSRGHVTVSGEGSAWTPSSRLLVGASGQGTLVIEAGAQVEAGAAQVAYGPIGPGTAVGQGQVTVTGRGSLLRITQEDLEVGVRGQGELQVLQGAQVQTQRYTIVGGGYGLPAGEASKADGLLVVDGEGSLLSSTSIFLGAAGKGALTISGGGEVRSTQGVAVGGEGDGSLTVEGIGSKLSADATTLSLGSQHEASTAQLRVAQGASVRSGQSEVRSQSGGSAAVTLTGKDSSWSTAGHALSVRAGGQSRMDIEAGARLSTGISAVSADGGTAAVSVSGPGSRWTLASVVDPSSPFAVLGGAICGSRPSSAATPR